MASENNKVPVYEAMDTLHGVQRGESSPENERKSSKEDVPRPTSSLHGQSGTEDQERRSKNENVRRSSSSSDSDDSEERSPAKNKDRQGGERRQKRERLRTPRSRSPHRHHRHSSSRDSRHSSSRSHRHSSNHRRSSSPSHSHRRHRKSSRSRSRSRSKKHSHRSPSRRSRRHRNRSKSPQPYKFGQDRAMDAQEKLARRLERAKQIMKNKEEQDRRGIEKLASKSANEKVQDALQRAAQMVSASHDPNVSGTVNKEIAAQVSAQVAALQAKALAETGIAVPSYYNPLAVNPLNYANQVAKRKKLWAKKEDCTKSAESATTSAETSAKTALWSGVKFGDNKSNEKFAKLMGIKQNQVDKNVSDEANEIIKKQQEVFQNLDLQYQQARITTHTQRGLGLGFSSSMIDPNAVVPQKDNIQIGTPVTKS